MIVQNGQLLALGTLGNNPVTIPINASTPANPADADCPILDLEINEIHLNLLGLQVELDSDIADLLPAAA